MNSTLSNSSKQKHIPNKARKSVLQKALQQLGENGEAWYQGAYGLDPLGVEIDSYVKDMVDHKFCSIGTLTQAVGHNVDWKDIPEVLLLGRLLDDDPKLGAEDLVDQVVEFNDDDDRTFSEIKYLFEEAIAMAEEE